MILHKLEYKNGLKTDRYENQLEKALVFKRYKMAFVSFQQKVEEYKKESWKNIFSHSITWSQLQATAYFSGSKFYQ